MTKSRELTRKAKNQTSKRSMGLLPSMLLMFLSALIVCVSLSILVFSLIGNKVYAHIKAKDMEPQLRGITATAGEYMQGSVDIKELLLLTRASDATLVILDGEGNEYFYHDPKSREGSRDEPGGMDPEGPQPGGMDPEGTLPGGMDPAGPQPGGDGGMQRPPWEDPDEPEKIQQHDDFVVYCRQKFEEVKEATSEDVFDDYASRLGVAVALPIERDGECAGAAFLIMPVNDLSQASKSLVYALIFSSILVALLMVGPIYAVTSWLTRPIKKMTNAALSLAEGDFSRRVDIAGSFEVRELGESFNTLADNLQENLGDLVVERNRLRAILDGMNEGIIGTDNKGGNLQYNAAAVALLGGKDGAAVEELPAYSKFVSAVERVLGGAEKAEESFACGERTVRLSTSAVHEENGDVVGTVTLLMDVTEAERLEQTRKDYVANVSHELRTPLASIRGIADMFNDGLVKSDSDKVRYYGYILRECDRLSTLINDLLELSRLQSGAVALKMRRVELYELAADVADRMTSPAAENGMTVELAVPEGRYYAVSNADRLEQVLIALVDNAVKHGTAGGKITIDLVPEGAKWLVSVSNPAQVEQQDIEHLFERFYKADTAHTGEGTGLGLAITEEVLRLMGESISVDYDGSLIKFTFTVQKDEKQ